MAQQRNIFAWLWGVNTDSFDVWPLWSLIQTGMQDEDTEAITAAAEGFRQAATAHNLPWLRVFGDHWELQHLATDLDLGAPALPKAIEAFERSLRPENRECPQSICAAQDVCLVYSNVDYRGFADDRIAASSDTLDRIDGTWPCYSCIASELVSGLIDAGRGREALDRLESAEREIRHNGGQPSLAFVDYQLDALLSEGLAEQAVELARTVNIGRYDNHEANGSLHTHHLHVARALVAAGLFDEATQILSPYEDPPREQGTIYSWKAYCIDALKAGARDNTATTGSVLIRVAQRFAARGAYRFGFETAVDAGHFAVQRGAVYTAKRCRELAVDLLAELEAPLEAPQQLAALDAAINQHDDLLADRQLEVAVDNIFSSADAPEHAAHMEYLAERLTKAIGDGTEEPRDFDVLAAVLRWQGWHDDATELLWERLRRDPSDEGHSTPLINSLFESGDIEGLDQLAAEVASSDRVAYHSALSRKAALEEDWHTTALECEQVCTRAPAATRSRDLWIHACRQVGDFGAAAYLSHEQLDALDSQWENSADGDERDFTERQRQSAAWNAAEVGSVVGDWVLVRRASASIGMVFESTEGPIDEPMASIGLVFREDDGTTTRHLAVRTGPATATVESVSWDQSAQRYGDRVVFRTAPVDSDEDESGQTTTLYFEPIVTTSKGQYRSYHVVGLLPPGEAGGEEWVALRDAAADAGLRLWSYGGEPLVDGDGRKWSRLFAALAVGDGRPSAEVDALLDSLTKHLDPQPVWSDLAEEVHGDRVGDLHRQRADEMFDGVVFDDAE